MGVDFSAGELAQLCQLISGSPSDILLKTDAEGFILQATQGIEHLGAPVPALLIPPRLVDLVAPHHADRIAAEHALAAAGNADRGWIEFQLVSDGESPLWFALKFTPAPDRKGQVLAALRNIHERRSLEEQVFAARMTDPLTGLTNRMAFDSMLSHVTEHEMHGCLGLLTIDRFRAINHRLGHSFGDQVLTGFADVLRAVMRSGDTLSRIGDAQFAVLFLGTEHDEAQQLCRQVLDVFAGELPVGKDSLPLSATAGIAEIGGSKDDTLRCAEMAMLLGKAGGKGRIELERPRQRKWRDRLPGAVPQMQRRAG